MSHTISIDVSSEQLNGINTTIAEGLGNFAIAAEKLQNVTKSAKEELSVTADIAKVKTAIGLLSKSITEATAAEKIKIAVAAGEIGIALNAIATHLRTIDPTTAIQTEISGIVNRFAAALQAALVIPAPIAQPASIAAVAPKIEVGTIDITGRVNDAILAKHFNVTQIDLTEKVAKAIKASTFAVKSVDLTAAVASKIDSAVFQIDPFDLTNTVAAKIGTDRFTIGEIDLTSAISTNITDRTFTTQTIDITDAVAASIAKLDLGITAALKPETTTAPIATTQPTVTIDPIDLTAAVAAKIDSSVFQVDRIDITNAIASNIAASIFDTAKIDLTAAIAASIDSSVFRIDPIDLTAEIASKIDSSVFQVERIDLSDSIIKAVSAGTFSTKTVDLSDRVDRGIEQTTVSIGQIDITDKIDEAVRRLVLTIEPVALTAAVAAKIDVDAFSLKPIDITAAVAAKIGKKSFVVNTLDLTAAIAAKISADVFQVDRIDLTAAVAAKIDSTVFEVDRIDLTRQIVEAIGPDRFSIDPIDLTAAVAAKVDGAVFQIDPIDLSAEIVTAVNKIAFDADRIDLTDRLQMAIDSAVIETRQLTGAVAPIAEIDPIVLTSGDLLSKLTIEPIAIPSETIASKIAIEPITLSGETIASKIAIEPIAPILLTSEDILSKLSIAPVSLTSDDLLSKISIATVNITELIAEAIGTIDMTEILDRSVQVTDAETKPTATKPDEALQKVLNIFENFSAEAETEALAAGEQIKNLDKMRATLVKIDKKFAELYTTQSATVELFKNITTSIETIAAKFATLAQDIESGKTEPTAAAEAAQTIVDDNTQRTRFTDTATSFARTNVALEGGIEFAQADGFDPAIAAAQKQRDDLIKNRAIELAAQGKELASGTPDADSLSAYADALLYFQEIVKTQSAEVRTAVAESLNLVKTGKDNLNAGKNFAAVSYFSKAKGEIGSIAGLGDALKARNAAGDYQNIGQLMDGTMSNNAKGMSGIGRAPDGATQNLRDLLRSTYAQSMNGDITAADLVKTIKAKIDAVKDTLTENDRRIVADHFAAFEARAKVLDRTEGTDRTDRAVKPPSKTPAIDKLGDDARQAVENLSVTMAAFYASMGETTRRTNNGIKAAIRRTKDLARSAQETKDNIVSGVSGAVEAVVETKNTIVDRAKTDTQKVKDGIETIAQKRDDAVDRGRATIDSIATNATKATKAATTTLSTIGALGEQIWGIGQTIGDKAAEFTAGGRRRKRNAKAQAVNYNIDFDRTSGADGGGLPPKPPKRTKTASGADPNPDDNASDLTNSRYRYAAGIARNNSKVARSTDMAAVGREATNQLERTDFDVLSQGVYVRRLKQNLDKLMNGTKREIAEAQKYINNVRRELEDLPDGTRIEVRKILNSKDRRDAAKVASESRAVDRAKSQAERSDRADAAKVAKDAKDIYRQELESYRQSVILGIPKNMGDLVRAAKALPDPTDRSAAKTQILRLKKTRTDEQMAQIAKVKEDQAKQIEAAQKAAAAAEADRIAEIGQRDLARYTRALIALSTVLTQIEAKAFSSIDDAEIALTEAAKNVRVSASVLPDKTQKSARRTIAKSLKDGYKALREPIEPIVTEPDVDALKSATKNVKPDDFSYEQKTFKEAVRKYNLKLISYQELRDLYARLPEMLISENLLDMVAIAKKDAEKTNKANKTKPVKDREQSKILGRIQVASVMGTAGNFESYNDIVRDVNDRFATDQKVIRAAYGLGQQRRKFAVKNTATDDLIAIQNADAIVTEELDRRYRAMVSKYSRQLSVAIKEANVNDRKTVVFYDPRLPVSYLEDTKSKVIDYDRSQVKIDERASKAKAVGLRDEGTVEALAELEAGFKQNLFGYASAYRQLNKVLSAKTANTEFEEEIQELKNQFQLSGIKPNFAKAQTLYKTELERQKLAILNNTFDTKIEQSQSIGFNKALKSAKTEFATNGAIAPTTLGQLNTLAVTIDQKRLFDLFQRSMVEQIQRNITKTLTDARSAVSRLIRSGDFDGAKAAIAASGFTTELADLQRSIVAKQQKAIIDRLKTLIAEARTDFDPIANRTAVPASFFKGQTPDIDKLDAQGTAATDAAIAAYEAWVKNQVKAYDKAQYNDALELARSGDTTDLAAIAASQSTKTREAQRTLAKLTSEFQQMSEEERAHVAAARAKMNAARSDRSDDRDDLIRAAFVTKPQMVSGRQTQAYQDNIAYINNQGQKTLNSNVADDKTKAINIQDLSGLYYTLKSITANIVDSLGRINEAATAMEKTMRKLTIVNNNDIGRNRADVASGVSLAAKYGNSERSYIDSIARYKASVPTEYDKFGTQLPSKVSDEGLRTIVEGLASAGVVNQLSADKMNDASTAIEQMFSKGTVQAEELIRQLANALPGVLSQFAQSQGIDTRELKRRMSQGEVSIDTLERFGEFQKQLYGKQAERGSLTKELNTLSGNTEDIRNSAGAASALSLEVGLSIVNTIVAGLKTNAMTFAIALTPAVGYLMGMVARVFLDSTLNNDIVKPRVEQVKAIAAKNVAPVGLLAGGLAVNAIGAKFAGEQSLDDALGKFTKNLGYAAEGLANLFSGFSPKSVTEKNNGTNSTIVGATLIGMAGISALRKNTGFFDAIGNIEQEIDRRTTRIGESVKSGVNRTFSSIGENGFQRASNFVQGNDSRIAGRAFGSINREEIERANQNRRAISQATGDLVTSLGLSMVALAFANTEFVSEYARQTRETMKSIEAARLAAFPNGNGAANGNDRLTVKEVKAKEELGFSFDTIIGGLNDDLGTLSRQYSQISTTRLEQYAKKGDKQAQAEIEQRQLGKTSRTGGLRTYSGNSDAESVETTFESQEKTRKILAEIDDDANFRKEIDAANKQKAKIVELKRLKKAALESGASDDEKVRIDSQTTIAEREYTRISKPILERKNIAIAAVKAIDTDRSNYLSSNEFKRDSRVEQQRKLAEFDKLRAEAQQYVESIAKKIEAFDIAEMVSKITKEFDTQNKKLDRELTRTQIGTANLERLSTSRRREEGDDLASGTRRNDIAVVSADKNADIAKRKLELAQKYEEAIQFLPSSPDQETKLQAAIDARIAAEKEYSSALNTKEQAILERQNKAEQRIQTEFENKQSYINNAASRREVKTRSTAEVSLDTRRQPEIDAKVADDIESAAVAKTKQTYESLKRIAKSIKVNKTAFDQKLDAARTEYENSLNNLNLAKRIRAREAQQRLESNAITDIGRSFDRTTIRLEERKQQREPLPAITNNLGADRNRADVSIANANDELQTAKRKIEEFAVLLAKIKSPDLKIEKTIEYERMVADLKKRAFDAEVARLNALKVRLDQLRSLTEALSANTSTRLGSQATALNTLNQYTQRDAGFRSINTEGKADDILQAEAKLQAANRAQKDIQTRFADAKTSIGASIDTAASVGRAQGVPFDAESLKSAIAQIGNMMVGDGTNANRGVMATDVEAFIADLRSSLDTAMQTRVGEEDVSVSAKLGKDAIPITGSPELLRQLIDNLNKFVPIVASKNQAENEKVNATNELKVARQQAAKELAEAKSTLDGNRAAYKTEIGAIERDISNAAQKFDRDVKILGSTAADAPTRISAQDISNKIADEVRDRARGTGTTTRRDLLERQIENLIRSTEVSRTQGSPERRAIAEVNLKTAIEGLTDSFNKTNLGNEKSIADSIYAMGADYMRTAAIARQTYTTLSDSLLSIQRAGTDLLSSYGVQRDLAYSVTSRRDENDRYSIGIQSYNPNDRAASAMYDAIGKLDTYREQVREFQKSLDYGKPTDAKAALNALSAKVDGGEIKSPAISAAIKKALGGIDLANISNKDAIEVFSQLSDLAQKLGITNEQYQKVVENAKRLSQLSDTADIADSNITTYESRAKEKSSQFRRGTIETIADGRTADDEITAKFNNRLAALRARTEAAIVSAGGVGTLRGQIERQKGINAERDIQNEYADLPLYGRQFSADIRDAVTSSTKFSTIFRDAIEKGDWGDVFGSTMRGILNKLSDTYSDRASKQLGDAVGGYVESLFGMQSALTGKIAGDNSPEPLELRSLFQDEPFDVATLFTDSRTDTDGTIDFNDIDGDIGNTIAESIGSKIKSGIGRSLGSSGFGGLFGAVGGLLGFADGKLTTEGFASGKMGSEYPITQNQAPSEPFQSRYALINEKELVLPPNAAQEYLDYRKAMSQGSTNIANSNTQNTTINNYNTSNYRSATIGTFGESAQSRRDSNKSRFDKR
jgi:tape measure domain-containing protein